MNERLAILKTRLLGLVVSFWLLVDLIGRFLLAIPLALWAVATGQEGAGPCAYETLSAQAGRAWLNKRLWARITVPVIDWMFCWQDKTLHLPDGRTFTHPSHCLRAFVAVRELVNMPKEYSAPLPPSLQDCYSSRDPIAQP